MFSYYHKVNEKMFKVKDKYHQIMLEENMKAAPDTSHFFLTRVMFFGHNFEGITITSLKSQINAILKLQTPSNKRNSKNSLEC